jgi:hypothetical protein
MTTGFLGALWTSFRTPKRDTAGRNEDAAEALEGDRGLIAAVLQVQAWADALADDAQDDNVAHPLPR